MSWARCSCRFSKSGSGATLDRFLRRWFDEHAFQSVTTAQFLEFLSKHLLSTKPGAVTDQEIQEWLHTESIPSFAVMPKSDALEKVERARDAWLGVVNRGTRQDIVCMVDPGMGALHRRATPKAGRRSPEHTGPVPEADGLAERRNRARVVPIGNREPSTAAFPAMERYMIRIGRRKLIVALYRDLATTTEGKAPRNTDLR